MSRRQRTTGATAEHPTRRRILDEAIVVLTEDGFDRFNVQRVLDGAGVSRATLYRHFTDVDGLIEAALVANFSNEADLVLRRAIEMVERSTDVESFRSELRGLLEALSMVPVAVRLRRAHAIALGATRPDLAAAIGDVQTQLTDGWEALLGDAQRKGLVRDDLDLRAAGIVIQSVGIGRVVDDATPQHISNERWVATFFDVLDRAILPPTP